MLPRVHNSHSLSPTTSQLPVLYRLPQHFPSQMDSDCRPDLCLPSSSDPNSIDFRTFYPYTPNEVKHRKRTSRAQLKVLEDHFRRDTKPNAALRKILAEQLDMSVRGVQVWFQNRRAKEKALAVKASSFRKPAITSKLGLNSPSEEGGSLQDDSPKSSPESDLVPESPSDSHQSSRSTSIPPDFDPSSHLPRLTTHHRPSIDSSNTSWHSPSPDQSGFTPQPSDFDLADLSLHQFRRGSLPAYPQYGSPSLDDFDTLLRRRSVDMSMHQLAAHPYAHVARAKNGALFAPHAGSFHSYPYGVHPRLKYNSGPQEFPVRAFNFTNQGNGSSGPSPYHAVRATIPGQHLHVISTRTVGSPIPGPLPSPSFSFGAADSSSSLPSPSERDSPESLSGMPPFAFPRREDPDAEDDETSTSSFSRFGSIASESSNTSAYYSDVGSCVGESVYDTEHRRASCGPGPFLDILSGLEVSGQQGHCETNGGSYASQKELCAAVNNPRDESDSQPTSAYPSPTSTASPGGSPHVQDANGSNIPISMSSELAYALRNSEDLDGGKDSPHQYPDVSNPPVADGETVPYFYDALSSNETDTAYPQPSSGTLSSPSLGLPMMDFGEKFQFEAEVSHISATGHYQGMSGPYVSSVGQYAPESGFRGSDEQGRDNHLHGMGFARSPDAYSSSYTPDTSVIALESFHSYT